MIRPQDSATPRPEGKPAWTDHVRRFKELGYERWRDETGYGKRFSEEQEMAALVNRFKDEIRARSRQVISKLLNARIVIHNLFTTLPNGCHIPHLENLRKIKPPLQTRLKRRPMKALMNAGEKSYQTDKAKCDRFFYEPLDSKSL